jgi:hypothetical protein
MTPSVLIVETRSDSAGCGSSGAAGLAAAFGDAVLQAPGVDGGVDGGGADVGVVGELADHGDVGARIERRLAAGYADQRREWPTASAVASGGASSLLRQPG